MDVCSSVWESWWVLKHLTIQYYRVDSIVLSHSTAGEVLPRPPFSVGFLKLDFSPLKYAGSTFWWHTRPAFLQGYNSIFNKAANYPRELESSFHGSGKFHSLMNTYVTTTILTFIFKWFQGVASIFITS